MIIKIAPSVDQYAWLNESNNQTLITVTKVFKVMTKKHYFKTFCTSEIKTVQCPLPKVKQLL